MGGHPVTVVVAIPWRDRGDQLRRAHHQAIRAWFDRTLDAPVLDCDGGGPWSLAGARNAGVRLAADIGADVVVVCDADNHPEAGPLANAIAGCVDDGLVHLPYTEYVNGSFRWAGSVGGIYVTTPDTWWAAGGQDERFRGWGCEDHAFVHAHATLLGAPMPRHPGVLTHLPHRAPAERDPRHPDHVAAAALLEAYRSADGDVAAMRALVADAVPR